MYGLEEAITELNEWKKLGDFEHIKELVQAEKEGRLRILKPANENTCGMCKNYIPEKGAYGRCAVREFQLNRWGQNTGSKFMLHDLALLAEKILSERKMIDGTNHNTWIQIRQPLCGVQFAELSDCSGSGQAPEV